MRGLRGKVHVGISAFPPGGYGMASTRIIGTDTLARKLDLVVAKVVTRVKKLTLTAERSLDFDFVFEWGLRRVPEQISDGEDTVEPEATAIPNGPGPTPNGLGHFFASLRKEDRDMLLADLLESGYPQIMASSRAMRREGMNLIWEKGVYRMNFGIMVRLNLGLNTIRRAPECPQPPYIIANNIQNLYVRVKAVISWDGALWSEMDLDNLKQFRGFQVRRKLCRIGLEIRYDKRALISSKVLNVLRKMVGFERLEVRLVYPPGTFSQWATPRDERRASFHVRDIYGYCERTLAPGLGRGVVAGDEDSHVMTFKPREAAVARASAKRGDRKA